MASDLREGLVKVLRGVYWHSPLAQADAIIAALPDLILTDERVERAAQAIHAVRFEEDGPVYDDERDMVRAALRAAM